MKPSNPADYFIDGYNKSAFTFTPGSTLFYVRIFSFSYIRISIVLFADSEEHVKKILLDWVEFKKSAARMYTAHPGRPLSVVLEDIDELRRAITGEGETTYNCVIAEAPTDRFYTVGWAENDTID